MKEKAKKWFEKVEKFCTDNSKELTEVGKVVAVFAIGYSMGYNRCIVDFLIAYNELKRG